MDDLHPAEARRGSSFTADRCQSGEAPAPAFRDNRDASPAYCPAFGSPVSVAEPANNDRPSVSFTVRALARLEPSFASEPFTVTVSPGFIEFRVQPRRIRPFGLPSSSSQLVTLPESSFTSI